MPRGESRESGERARAGAGTDEVPLANGLPEVSHPLEQAARHVDLTGDVRLRSAWFSRRPELPAHSLRRAQLQDRRLGGAGGRAIPALEAHGRSAADQRAQRLLDLRGEVRGTGAPAILPLPHRGASSSRWATSRYPGQNPASEYCT